MTLDGAAYVACSRRISATDHTIRQRMMSATKWTELTFGCAAERTRRQTTWSSSYRMYLIASQSYLLPILTIHHTMTPHHSRYHTSWSMGCSPGAGGFYRYRRGPSRFLWFIVGAGAASWYIKRSQSGHSNSVGWQPSPNGPNQQQQHYNPSSMVTPGSTQAPPPPSHYPPQAAAPVYQNPQRLPEPPVQVAKAEESVINQGVSEAVRSILFIRFVTDY